MNMEQAISTLPNILNDAECAQNARANKRSYAVAIMHVAWLLTAALGVTMFLMSLPVRIQQLNPTTIADRPAWSAFQSRLGYLNMSREFFTNYVLFFEILFTVTFFAAALLIFWRRPSDKMALFTSFMFLMTAVASYPVVNITRALLNVDLGWKLLGVDLSWTPVLTGMNAITWVAIFVFFCVFPDGKFSPGWTKWTTLAAIILIVPATFFPEGRLDIVGMSIPVNPWRWTWWLAVPVELGLWASVIVAQVSRFRNHSDTSEKQQGKWLLYGFTLSIVSILTLALLPIINPELKQPWKNESLTYLLVSTAVQSLAGIVVPITVSFSISRYRLWNIDLIINRTLVYVALTGILAGVYTASITFFQKMLMAANITSDMAIVFATLILASTFTPIKNYLQVAVDNRFKEAHDPISELQSFNKQVQSVLQVLDAHQITRRLLDEATFALGAQGGAVYMGHDGDLHMVHSSENWNGITEISVPIRSEGERVGLVALGPRRNGADYTEKDREMLQQVVDVVGRAIMLSKAGV